MNRKLILKSPGFVTSRSNISQLNRPDLTALPERGNWHITSIPASPLSTTTYQWATFDIRSARHFPNYMWTLINVYLVLFMTSRRCRRVMKPSPRLWLQQIMSIFHPNRWLNETCITFSVSKYTLIHTWESNIAPSFKEVSISLSKRIFCDMTIFYDLTLCWLYTLSWDS